MPLDNIDRAIKKATGEAGAKDIEEITYEGRGPSGVAIIIEAMTDNRNRTVADLRAALVRAGGNLGETGSSAFMFDHKGVITLEDSPDPDEILLLAADAGADDIQADEDEVSVLTPPDKLEEVRRALEAKGVRIAAAELSMLPKTTVELDGKTSEQLLKLLDKLEDHDDVQKVYTNAEFADEAMAAYSG
jgi:YebC/PmpR family DNA-binding regulatory protein